VFFVLPRLGVGACRVKAAGSRRGREAPAKRPEGLDADAARRSLVDAEEEAG